jgi:hypothetical protein
VFTSFIGFEAAVPLAEEAREPRKTVPRAVLLACLIIGSSTSSPPSPPTPTWARRTCSPSAVLAAAARGFSSPVIGVGYLIYLLRRHPDRIRDMDKVFD